MIGIGAAVGKGLDLIKSGFNAIPQAMQNKRLATKGSVENREVRQHETALAQLDYRKQLVSQTLFFMVAFNFVWMFFLMVNSPILSLIPGFGDIIDQYRVIYDTIGQEAVLMVLGSILGLSKLQEYASNKQMASIAKAQIQHKTEVEKKKIEVKGNNQEPFDEAYEIMAKHEGGYVDDPDDRGGETYKGITKKYHGSWKGWKIIDSMKKDDSFPKCLTKDAELQSLVKDFYHNEYWEKFKCDKISSRKIAIELYDTAVNTDRNAVKFLQRAISRCNYGTDIPDLNDDGVIGNKTLQALESLLPKYEKAVFNAMNGEQYKHYDKICANDPTQEKFFKGWMNRV